MDIASVSFETKCIAYLSAVSEDDEGNIIRRATGTGFFWRHSGIPYLITNRHNVTGRDQYNRQIKNGFDPISLQTYFRVPGERVANDASRYEDRQIEFHLWKDGEPAWQEHPGGSTIDVVALGLENFPDNVHCVNDKLQYDHWKPEVGIDCFIVGYPESLAGSEGTAIWKRASIASEPEMDVGGVPIFLCDSATREGMSGAPVFAKMLGDFSSEGKLFAEKDVPKFFGHWTKFLGVYSGRNGDEEYGFQLGRVWKAHLIDEILKNTHTPESPWVPKPVS